MKGGVLLTGARGAIGPTVAEGLAEAGYEVRQFDRAVVPASGDCDPGRQVRGDLADEACVREAVRGMDYVVHLAAILDTGAARLEPDSEMWRVNVQGTRNLVEAAVAAGVKRVVLFSSTSVYGATSAEPVTEAAPVRPVSAYAKSKVEAEKLALGARRQDGTPLAVVLRLAAVYGPRVRGNYRRLITALDKGRFVPFGSGDNLRTLVYVEDVARAAVLALEQDAAAGGVFNVTDGRVHPMREIIESICAALGRNPPRWHLPGWPFRLCRRLMAKNPELFRKRFLAPAAAMMVYFDHSAVDGSKACRELGFQPGFELRRGMEETVRQMRTWKKL